MNSIYLSRAGFPRVIKHKGRTWRKVRDEEHRDKLESKDTYDYVQVYEKMDFGFSFNLYYSEWKFDPTPKDKFIIKELDQMLAHFLLEKCKTVV